MRKPDVARRGALHRGAYANEKVEIASVCPVTGQIKGYPFEVLLPDGLPVTGAILADQAKSLDWRDRDVEWMGHLTLE